MPHKKKTKRPKLITDSKTGLRITKSPAAIKVPSEDVRCEQLKKRQRKMSRAATEEFWEEERGDRITKEKKMPKRLKAPRRLLTEPSIFDHHLRASRMPEGSLVIQGTLPDGKYLVLEVHGKKVKVAFFGSPAEPRW